MNNEQPNQPDHPKEPQPGEQPKHRGEREPLIGDYFTHLIDTAADPVAAARISEAHGYHGTAIAAFLGLGDIDPYSADIALDFLNCYHGRYPTMSELIDEVIETHGWDRALDRVFDEHPELQSLVSIDREGVAELVDMRFDVVDLGELYVFEK